VVHNSNLTTSSFQPPNDPHHITRDDLVLALRGVLSATPLFAEVKKNHGDDNFIVTHPVAMPTTNNGEAIIRCY